MPGSADLDELARLLSGRSQTYREFLDSGDSAIVARAPGRLDVLGGIADYSGSLVLEYPLAEAAWALIQPRSDRRVRIMSASSDARSPLVFDTTTAALGADGNPFEPDRARDLFVGPDRWAAYLAGCWTVLATHRPDRDLKGGANLLLASSVPPGAGVSSSAAIEVATMRALTAGLEVPGLDLARWCQQVENGVAGAPCGIMDQVTSALGREGEILELVCRPHDLEGYASLPARVSIAGIDTGIKHAVGGSAYTRARVAAFMGLRILSSDSESGSSDVAGPGLSDRYLASLAVEAFESRCESLLPRRISGRDFLDRYGETIDPITRVDPDEVYSVRACAAFPIRENGRARDFLASLGRRDYESAGEAMYRSHDGYGECGLGSEECDFLVRAIRSVGPGRGLFGARTTGGGSGGTVAVLMSSDPDARHALDEVRTAYGNQFRAKAGVFVGSSPGAMFWKPVRCSLSTILEVS